MYGEKSSMIVQRLPHACGGVFARALEVPGVAQSSPRMWGCFRSHSMGASRLAVFPTHVGVFSYPSRAAHE